MPRTATATAVPRSPSLPASTSARTAALLGAGVVAGPAWIAVAAAQALTRDGFDLTRHPISVLSNGDLGWIQIANFLICGALIVAAATAVRRVVTEGRGATWGPRLVALVGLGMVAAGVFVADPLDGFPAGTPLGRPETMSAHGALHFLFATVSFVALVAAAFVMARRFRADGDRSFARYSVASAAAFLMAWAGVMAAPDADATNVGFAAGAAIMLIWVSALCARLRQRVQA